MNWRRGLLGLWLVLSLGWVVSIGVVAWETDVSPPTPRPQAVQVVIDCTDALVSDLDEVRKAEDHFEDILSGGFEYPHDTLRHQIWRCSMGQTDGLSVTATT